MSGVDMTLCACTRSIDEDYIDTEIDLVTQLLTQRNSLILLLDDQMITLRETPSEIHCEVIDTMPNSHRCAEEFKVLVENAQRSLANSQLARYFPLKPIENGSKGRVELWPATYNE